MAWNEGRMIEVSRGVLQEVDRDGWPFWELKGAAQVWELTNALPLVRPEPEEARNRKRADRLIKKFSYDIDNLFSKGGLVDGTGFILETSADSFEDVREMQKRMKNRGLERFTYQELAQWGIEIANSAGKALKQGVVYAVAPGLGEALVPVVDERENLFYVAPQLDNFNGDGLTTLKRYLLPEHVKYLEAYYGVTPIYTAPALVRASIFSSVPARYGVRSLARG